MLAGQLAPKHAANGTQYHDPEYGRNDLVRECR